MAICDGCGQSASEIHTRERIERLELATRFRPVHIKFLLLEPAPPARQEDYFYRAAQDRGDRSVRSKMYFDELTKCAQEKDDLPHDEAAALANFQRQGFFLASVVECPVNDETRLAEALGTFAPTVVRRMETSYKPKYVVPLGLSMRSLIPYFEVSGLKDRLVLFEGGPFDDPFMGDPQNQAEFGTFLGDRLRRGLSGLS